MKVNSLRIEDVCDFIGGSQPPKSDFIFEPREGYVRLIQTRDYKTDSFVTYIPENSTQKFCDEKDIMIGRYGPPIFQICRGLKGAYNVALLKAKPKNNIDREYLYYFLKQEYVFQYVDKLSARTGGQTGVDLVSLNKYPIQLPENIEDQKKLVAILYAIDAKIELNNRINAELESMAKTLYDYWFVQFDFPFDFDQGKPAANGKPYKSSGGKMVYNPTLKREIPEGWEVVPLANWIANDKTGDWGEEAPKGNYTLQVVCIRGADINGLNGSGKISAPSRFILEKNHHKILSPYDFIIEISGGSPTQSTGRMAFLIEETLSRFSYPLICSNFCKAISLKENIFFYNFAYQWANIYDSGLLFGWEGKTSGIKNLLFDAFVNKHMVCKPPKELAQKFFYFASPLQNKKQKLLKENEYLESLRDWLLPMLMNGQVTVKQ